MLNYHKDPSVQPSRQLRNPKPSSVNPKPLMVPVVSPMLGHFKKTRHPFEGPYDGGPQRTVCPHPYTRALELSI